jgi:hypothetical protein
VHGGAFVDSEWKVSMYLSRAGIVVSSGPPSKVTSSLNLGCNCDVGQAFSLVDSLKKPTGVAQCSEELPLDIFLDKH